MLRELVWVVSSWTFESCGVYAIWSAVVRNMPLDNVWLLNYCLLMFPELGFKAPWSRTVHVSPERLCSLQHTALPLEGCCRYEVH